MGQTEEGPGTLLDFTVHHNDTRTLQENTFRAV